MAHWKITLSYDGTRYHGWQVQPGRATVQGELAAALAEVTGETALPQGSGRTDAGVHALAQVASVTLDVPIPAANLMRALNQALPASVRVLAVEEAAEGFHARHSAVRKNYEYRIFERVRTGEAERVCPPFTSPYVWDCRWALNVEAMQRAAETLVGTWDFSSFAASDPDKSTRERAKEALITSPSAEASVPSGANAPVLAGVSAGVNPVKTIVVSEVQREGELVVYRVVGSGFLHHMVRNIVGTLVEVGRGALRAEEMAAILQARDRAAAGPTAPPQGLFLVGVEYGEVEG